MPLKMRGLVLLGLALASIVAASCSEKSTLLLQTEIAVKSGRLEEAIKSVNSVWARCRFKASAATPSVRYPNEGNVFVHVAFELRNISDSTLSLDQSDFKLVAEDSSVYTPPWPATLTLVCYDLDRLFVDYQLGMGDSVSVEVVFDIPKMGRLRNLTMRFRDDPLVIVPLSQLLSGARGSELSRGGGTLGDLVWGVSR
jgi:hypothetical protein